MVYGCGGKNGTSGRAVLCTGWNGEQNIIRYGNLYLECAALVIRGRNTDLREDGTVVKGCISGKGSGWETGKDEFNFCFRRLITRGLITFCECETEKEAAENLLQNAIVARVMRNSGERFLMFCESFACGTPFWKALRVFKKEPMEERYRQFLLKIEKCGEVRYYLETTEQPNEILEMLSLLYQKKILFIRSVKEVTIEA